MYEKGKLDEYWSILMSGTLYYYAAVDFDAHEVSSQVWRSRLRLSRGNFKPEDDTRVAV